MTYSDISPPCIYGLFDPRTDELRYVGKTEVDFRVRLTKHLNEAKSNRSQDHKNRWIRKLLSLGLSPQIEVFESAPSDINEAERWHISYWKFLGCRLTNCGQGGDGQKHTEESKLKIGRANSNLTPEQESLIEALYEQGLSCGKIGIQLEVSGSVIHRALKRLGITRRSTSEPGRKFSEAAKARMSAAQRVAQPLRRKRHLL